MIKLRLYEKLIISGKHRELSYFEFIVKQDDYDVCFNQLCSNCAFNKEKACDNLSFHISKQLNTTFYGI